MGMPSTRMGNILKPQSIARQIARDLRKKQTKSEEIFWQKVRNRQFLGLKFTRQHPIFYKYDHYRRFFIADFYCAEFKLVIEIDGGIHQNQKDYDQKRTEILESKKIRIIRFTNSEVNRNINKVLIDLKHNIDKLKLIPDPSLKHNRREKDWSFYEMFPSLLY